MGQNVITGTEPSPEKPSFDDFYKEMFKDLLKYRWALGNVSLHDAEDAVQNTMLEVYRRWDGIVQPRAYAYTVFIRQCGRTRSKESPLPGDELPQRLTEDRALTEYEEWQWVMGLLKRLPPRQRVVMVALIRGLTYAEFLDEVLEDTAEERTSPSAWERALAAVRSNVKHAKRQLKIYLGLEDEGR